jgi:hypothetical protein
VYLAEDPFANRKVAIKLAYPDALKSSEDGAFYRSMFLNEAALAGKLSHPHIVQIYDAVVDETSSYIVMEYVEGGTLEKFCKPDALLPTRDVAEIIFKCVRALAFAHTLGLTHRDIKPGNILHKRRHRDQARRLRRRHQPRFGPDDHRQRRLPRIHGARAGDRRHRSVARDRHLRARHRHVLHAHRKAAVLRGQHDERDLPDREHGTGPAGKHREASPRSSKPS